MVSTHRLSCPPPSPFPFSPPPTPLPFDQNQASRPSKLRSPLTGFSTYRIHLINGCISFHRCHILSRSETGLKVSAQRLTNITLMTLIATQQLQGESPTYILNEHTQPVIRAIGVSHTGCKYEFRQNIRPHRSSVFHS